MSNSYSSSYSPSPVPLWMTMCSPSSTKSLDSIEMFDQNFSSDFLDVPVSDIIDHLKESLITQVQELTDSLEVITKDHHHTPPFFTFNVNRFIDSSFYYLLNGRRYFLSAVKLIS
ncbi:hypothetical protein GEMRC1_013659 [Eukaryota sp. GEM-RC1]